MTRVPERWTRRHVDLLRDIAEFNGRREPYGIYTYAYLPLWKQRDGAGWDEARMYVTREPCHTPGLCSEVTGAARDFLEAGLIVLGESGRRRSERPLLLTDAGHALPTDLIRR